MPAGFVPGIVNSKHIKEELTNLKLPEGCSVKDADVFKWQVTLKGPPGTAYERGEFNLEVDFPHSTSSWTDDYPGCAPKLRFTESRKIYHCNVDENGGVHLDILKSKYNKDVGISKILEAVYAMFANPDLDGAVRQDIVKMYREDRATHDKVARDRMDNRQPVDVAPPVLIAAPPVMVPTLVDYSPDPYADMMDRMKRESAGIPHYIEYREAPTLV